MSDGSRISAQLHAGTGDGAAGSNRYNEEPEQPEPPRQNKNPQPKNNRITESQLGSATHLHRADAVVTGVHHTCADRPLGLARVLDRERVRGVVEGDLLRLATATTAATRLLGARDFLRDDNFGVVGTTLKKTIRISLASSLFR